MLVVIWLYNKVVVKFNELIFKLVVNGIMNFIDIYIMFRFKINYLFKKKIMIWFDIERCILNIIVLYFKMVDYKNLDNFYIWCIFVKDSKCL